MNEAKPHAYWFWLAVGCMLLSGIENILPSWLIKISIDGLSALEHGFKDFQILPNQAQDLLTKQGWDLSGFRLDTSNLYFSLPMMIVVIFTVDACFKFIYQLCVRELGLRTVRDMRNKFHDHINHMSLSTQAKFDSGSLVSVVTNDLHSLQSWVSESITNLFLDGTKLIFLFAWLLVLDWKLTLLSLVTIPLFAIPVIYLGKKIRSYSKSGQDYLGTLTSFVSESLYNQKIIKAFNLEPWRQKQFSKESENLYNLHKKWVLFMALVSPITNIIGAIGIAVILSFGLIAVTHGSITVGEFSSFFVTSILLYDPVKRIGRVSTIIQSALGVAERVFSFIDEPAQEASTQINSTNIFSGKIEFRNISFSYPNGENLFDNLSLVIPAQSSLALVGPSGSGKTSLVSLIPRFFEITGGEILVDDIDIKDLSLGDLRKQIAIVTQDPLLFTGTIKDNILLGCDVSVMPQLELDARFNYALKAAHVAEFIDDMEQGIHSHIGERGQNLSIGQRQRLSIARAFMSSAPILILDEPTSALDNESQAYVYDAIQSLMKLKTVIVIAHRLSTVKTCDQIAFMQDGRILESGRHEDLMTKGGLYSRLSSEVLV